MSFLSPLFLLGTLAIVGPIIFHLIRRTTREQTPFSSLMFLQPTPPRVTRRSRLENPWLLLLRCLVIALLALAFARPLFQHAASAPPLSDSRKRTVVLLDTSASMRRGELWKTALQRAEQWVEKTDVDGELAVLSFARAVTPLVNFEEWRTTPVAEREALAVARLRAAQPGWSGTNLGSALLHAAELLDAGRDPMGANEIVVISDLQEGAKLDGLQGFGWPKGVRVVLDSVAADSADNVSAQWLADSTGEGPQGVRLRVQNSPNAKREQFRVQWQADALTSGVDVYVPPGQARAVQVPMPPADTEKIIVSGDAVDFDNTLYVIPPEPAKLSVLFLGNEQAQDPQAALYYLHRGFPATRQQTVELLVRPPQPAPSAYEMQRAQLLVLGEGLDETTITAAREFATEGKIVLYPLPSANAAPALAKLFGVAQVAIEEARGPGHALFGQLDFTHPLFAPFADPRYSDFTKIHFWKHRNVTLEGIPNAKVLARFDDRSPALVQVPLGRGSVVVLTTTWKPADSQLALSSKFVPLLHSLLEQSSAIPPRQAQYFVGENIPLPSGTQPFKVRGPSGKETEVPAGGTFTATDEPGIYAVMPAPLRLVVNLAPEESRLVPLDPARLSALGVPLQGSDAAEAKASVANPAVIQAMEVESRQKLWRWLLLGAIVVLLLETPIAAKLSRSPVQPVSS
jgi:hypothetical protein